MGRFTARPDRLSPIDRHSTHAHTCTHTYIHVNTYTYAHTYSYTYTHTRTCMHAHALLHTHTYTHAHTASAVSSRPLRQENDPVLGHIGHIQSRYLGTYVTCIFRHNFTCNYLCTSAFNNEELTNKVKDSLKYIKFIQNSCSSAPS